MASPAHHSSNNTDRTTDRHNTRDHRREPRDDRPRDDRPRDGGPREYPRSAGNGARSAFTSSSRGTGGRGGRSEEYRRGGDRRDDHRDRARSRSPARHNDDRTRRSPPPPSTRRPQDPRAPHSLSTPMDLDATPSEDESLDDEAREEKKMKKVMGFVKFRSTKDTKVPGNDRLYGVRRDKQVQYRQYMNRNGGFNRPLSPSRM